MTAGQGWRFADGMTPMPRPREVDAPDTETEQAPATEATS